MDRVIAMRNRLLVARGWGAGGGRRQVGVVEKDHRKCLYGNGSALHLDWSVSASWLGYCITGLQDVISEESEKGLHGNHCFISCKMNNPKIKRSIKKKRRGLGHKSIPILCEAWMEVAPPPVSCKEAKTIHQDLSESTHISRTALVPWFPGVFGRTRATVPGKGGDQPMQRSAGSHQMGLSGPLRATVATSPVLLWDVPLSAPQPPLYGPCLQKFLWK